ncbi:hypothetical protein SAMN06297129_2168 [Pseudooceanicola antarcticus]|uniref:DUF6538 domain-containing protein n=1 Tax=Pseudooceanicola antarcticus TaxID=1247613 RepID=A0A285IU90_9RHOB|nr:DUF6538 domain-containing protein [Pseudooceanicola antarcticus]PJE32106.1 hypothetical protein CVM39_03185 [Pseudooceanicola antarcticus]SNY51579.1 hypothetical protein SAMN06297129_2168 [Pseudooceanicola antarcticus]
MSEIRVEGAKLIGETWHYHKRIPKRLREAFGLPEFKRGTMRTKDPDEARRLARAMLAELDQMARQLDSVSARVGVFADLSNKEQAALLDEVEANVKTLPIEQRQAIRKAGGVFEAGRKMREHEVQAAFLRAADRHVNHHA